MMQQATGNSSKQEESTRTKKQAIQIYILFRHKNKGYNLRMHRANLQETRTEEQEAFLQT
jgi:hypothetical protein